MRRRLLGLTAAAVLAAGLTLPSASVGATPPLDLAIENPMTISDTPSGDVPFTGTGPFTATGAAVDAGLVCGAGTSLTIAWSQSAYQPASEWVNFHVVHEFTCDDGSGSFYVQLQARFDQKGDNFNWVIKGGTGDYERLHGSGSGVGLPPGPQDTFNVLDLYSGQAHSD